MDNGDELLDSSLRRALLDVVPCAVIVGDADRRILYWNRAAEELTGYSAAEMVGQTCQVLQERLAPDADGELAEAVCPYSRSGGERDEEVDIRRKDGTVVPVLRRVRAVGGAGGAGAAAFVQVLVDVRYVKEARGRIRALQRDLARAGRFGELIGGSPPMRKLYEAIELVAATDAAVVIEGETGTGKELVARTIHARSRRAGRTFLAVNCGALPETLLEAELFGHVRGAFTGAVADRAGRFEEAAGGTLLLDEVTEMSLASQVKLLRALQSGEVTRVGESRPRKADVRIIAATNRDLAAEVAAGRFREDLYYRLRVVGLKVPPLRQRQDDIPDLVSHFIEQLNRRYGRGVQAASAEAMRRLYDHAWPGNVRELEHALEHAFVVTPATQHLLPAEALPPEVLAAAAPPAEAAPAPAVPRGAAAPDEQRRRILAALEAAGGNKSAAARALGLTRAGLYKKLKRLGIG